MLFESEALSPPFYICLWFWAKESLITGDTLRCVGNLLLWRLFHKDLLISMGEINTMKGNTRKIYYSQGISIDLKGFALEMGILPY